MLESNATAPFLTIFGQQNRCVRWSRFFCRYFVEKVIFFSKAMETLLSACRLPRTLALTTSHLRSVNYVISSGVPMTPWLRKSICPGLTRPMARPGQSVSTKKEKSTNVWQCGPRKKQPRTSTASCKKKGSATRPFSLPTVRFAQENIGLLLHATKE